jgi:hypothetical protein
MEVRDNDYIVEEQRYTLNLKQKRRHLMSNTTKKTATQVANEVASFQNEMESVRNTAIEWHNTEYATSNARLYGIFGKLYAVWETLVDLDNANTKKREWIEAAVCKKGVSLPKKPTTHQLLINYAFFVEGIDYQLQQKRVSTYTRVFKTATATDGVYADNIAEWITSNGGIENIRQQNTKSAITKAERISNGKQLLIGAYINLSVFQIDSDSISNRDRE